MKTLADEIAEFITNEPQTLAEVSAGLGADRKDVRRAAQTGNDDGRVLLVLINRVLHVVSSDYPFPVCRNCYRIFERPAGSIRQCCTRACSIAWSWKKPGVKERRIASIKVERASPAAMKRLQDHNERRWAKPEEHERLSAQNRREWSDPKKAAKRAASIRAVNGSESARQHASQVRKAFWRDPESRDKMLAGMRIAHKKPETRSKHAAACRRRYTEPASREKYLEVSRRNIVKATAAITGKKQSPEQVQKRVEAVRANRLHKKALNIEDKSEVELPDGL